MGRIKIPYVERDGILYPVLTIPKDMELSAVGKYGLLWLSYMKENHKQRYRTLARLPVEMHGSIERNRKQISNRF